MHMVLYFCAHFPSLLPNAYGSLLLSPFAKYNYHNYVVIYFHHGYCHFVIGAVSS